MSCSFSIPPPQVLVVEDDYKLAALLCRALNQDDFAAEFVLDGAGALRRLADSSFDAVVLDVGLPSVSGLEVCTRLRAAGSSVPVLMLSARDSTEDVDAGRRAGATDYLLKPFSLGELVRRLNDLIGSRTGPHGQLIDAA